MNLRRSRIAVTGAVQGVGFRPFVYRLATEMRLNGWVSNSSQGVLIEVEGLEKDLNSFRTRLENEKPALAVVHGIRESLMAPASYENFEIRESDSAGDKTALILPDIAACNDCLREIFDPANRRYLYPFTNCTNCGPRFSIIEALPYDRVNTSMKQFEMCPDCSREYHDPLDRRFHAQPNACPKCGPRPKLWNPDGEELASNDEALFQAVESIRAGHILALKGIGGFQLIVDASNDEAVRRLRECKRREDKPFALMFPSIEAVRMTCHVTSLESDLLLSPSAPIVLVRKKNHNVPLIIASVAPNNPWLGAMLPYSPLHHVLMRALGIPLVATSGNLTDEPICIDEREALNRLRGIADVFLVHNRPIVRHVDDSVVRVMAGREMMLRRARGYAPLPMLIEQSEPRPEYSNAAILALGAHLKNSVALGVAQKAFLSQHIGDLETAEAFAAFRRSASDLPQLYQASPELIAGDLHPEYLSTKFARELEAKSQARFIGVQHHYAHVLSCMADNGLNGPVLGNSWDGTGLGTDATIWGGEFLLVNETGFRRFAHFRCFRLPGGDSAIKQPRRSALGLLYEILGAEMFSRGEIELLRHFSRSECQMLERMLAAGINSPLTSSAGRLFDAVASLVGLRQRASFEGQGAMELEFACAEDINDAYPFDLRNGESIVFDWEPMINSLLDEIREKQSIGIIAAKFHNTLVEGAVGIAKAANIKNVVLSGGCFQNQYLTERIIRRLREEGFAPYWHRSVPPNDGGIAAGQILAARRFLRMNPEMGFKPNGCANELAPESVEPVSSL